MLDMHTQALGLPPLLWDAQPLPRQFAGLLRRAYARRRPGDIPIS